MCITLSTRTLLATASLLLVCACSSPSTHAPDGGDGSCPPYESDADLTTPVVSFEQNVLPIFEANCSAGTTCHGGDPAMAISQRGVFLGCVPEAVPDAGPCQVTTDPGPQVYAGLVGPDAAAPLEESCMPFVKPGDSKQSYLMHKIDDDLCAVTCCIADNDAAATVSEMGCGGIMPFLGTRLDGPTRDTIRRWIDQGAAKN